MHNPKTEVYATLKALGHKVLQGSQSTLAKIPCITYFIEGHSVQEDLSNQIAYQNINIRIDIWADDSKTATAILEQVESKMRSINYHMTNSLDIPNPDPSLFHITCSFRTTKFPKS